MAVIDEIIAIGKQVFSEATNIVVYPAGDGSVAFGGTDPRKLRFVAMASDDAIIWQFEAETLEEIRSELSRRLDAG